MNSLLCQHCGKKEPVVVPCGCEPFEHPEYASCNDCFEHMDLLESGKGGLQGCSQCLDFLQRQGLILKENFV